MKEDNSFPWRTFKHTYEGLNTVFAAGGSYSKQLGAYSSRTECNEEQSANKTAPEKMEGVSQGQRGPQRILDNSEIH